MTTSHHLANEVVVDRALELSQRIIVLLEVSHQQVSQVHSLLHAASEVQLHILWQDAVQQSLDELFVNLCMTEAEHQRVNATVQHIEGFLVSLCRISYLQVLTYKPSVVFLLVTSQIREFARKRVDGLQILHILQAIERKHIESFIGSPDKFLVEWSAFQVGSNLLNPLFGSGWRELREKLFFQFCHC